MSNVNEPSNTLVDFYDNQMTKIKNLYFWEDHYNSFIYHAVESRFNREILKFHHITNIKELDDKRMMIQWSKRILPLTDEQIVERYGK